MWHKHTLATIAQAKIMCQIHKPAVIRLQCCCRNVCVVMPKTYRLDKHDIILDEANQHWKA